MHWLPRLACRVLRQSPHVPRHVAFIMDGNRRFAQQQHAQTHEGHSKGYDKLKETLEWCLELGVQMVTVYAFSIDNFKRSPEEVAQLMRLAKEKFIEMIQRLDMIEKHGCCVRVLGDLSLLPADVRSAMEDAVAASRHKTRVTLNVCMSYSHQRELAKAESLVLDALEQGILITDDVDADLVQSSLYTGISAGIASERAAAAAAAAAGASACCNAAESDAAHATACTSSSSSSFHPSDDDDAWLVPAAPSLLIRTSGETRLSDFLCFQSSSDTQLSFTRTLWPDFSLLELAGMMLEYQRVAPGLEQRRRERRDRERKDRQRSDERIVRQAVRRERAAQAQALREQRRAAAEAVAAQCEASYAAADSSDAVATSAATMEEGETTSLLPRSSSSLSASSSTSAASSSHDGSSGCCDRTGASPSPSKAHHCTTVAADAVCTTSEEGSEHSDECVSSSSSSSSHSSEAGSGASSAHHSPLCRSAQGSPFHPPPSPPPAAPLSAPLQLEETAAGLRAYWRTGGVSERALLTQRRRPFSSAPTTAISQEQHRQLQMLATRKDEHHASATDAAAADELFDDAEYDDDDQCDPNALAAADADEDATAELDEAEVQRRVAVYAAERKRRLRAFALFARKHTSCFI